MRQVTALQNGFTLIEIIVVLIILGTLAALSLKFSFNMIDQSRSAEVLPVLRTSADQIDACILTGKGSIATCITTYSFPSTTHSNFVSSGSPGAAGYMFTYARNLTDTGHSSYDWPLVTASCPNLGSSGGNYAGTISVCSYPQTGGNVDPNAGRRFFSGTGL